MSEIQDRPASLRRKPRPAADEKVDPVDYQPNVPSTPPMIVDVEPTLPPQPEASRGEATQVSGPTAAERIDVVPITVRRGRPRGREVTIPFSTRIAQDVSDIIDNAVDREGITQRSVIEIAVRAYWGPHSQD